MLQLHRRAALMVGLCAVFAAVTAPSAWSSAPLRPASVSAQSPNIVGGPIPARGTLPPRVTARSAIVIDAATGVTLMEKNANQPLPPASLTKIVTALVALDRLDLKRRVTVATDVRAELDPDSTVMGLDSGETLTVEDLLYGLMLPSGNDAAVVLGRTVANSDAAFVDLMNRTVRAYGLRNTTFANAHGLDQAGHTTTAYDIAQLSRYAMRDERFRRIVAARSWTVRSQWTYTLFNRNRFLTSYSGADGVKTGWTEAAGATIVASATRNNHRVIVALLDSSDRVSESSALLNWAFATFRWPGDAPVTQAETD